MGNQNPANDKFHWHRPEQPRSKPQGPRPVPQQFRQECVANLQFTEDPALPGRKVAYMGGKEVVPGSYGDFRFDPKVVEDSSQVKEKTYRCVIVRVDDVLVALPHDSPRYVATGEWTRIKVPVVASPALPRPRSAEKASKGPVTVPVVAKDKSVIAHPDDQTLVCLREYGARDGKLYLESAADLVFKVKVFSIYKVLSAPDLGIRTTAASSELEIDSAAERVAQSVAKFIRKDEEDKRKSIAGMNALAINDALYEAKKRALALLTKGAADVPATDGVTTERTGDRPAKHRRRGGKGRHGRTGGEQQTTAAPVQAVASESAGPPSATATGDLRPQGSLGTVGDMLGEAMTSAEEMPVVIVDLESAPAAMLVVIVEETAPESDSVATIVVPEPEAVAAARPVVEKASVAASAAKESSDEDEIVVYANDPNLMGLPAFHKPHSMEQVIAGVRYAISKGKCKDVASFEIGSRRAT